MTQQAPSAPRGGSRGARPSAHRMRTLQRHGWMSDQHGAWAMMALPPLLGWALSGRFSWLVLLLLVAWAMAFQLFSATCLWVKTPAKRRGRILPALVTFGVATAIPGIALLASRPQLLWWGCAFAPLASCALFLVWRGRERSLATRAASILAGNVMGPVAFSLASADGSPVAVSAHAWAACAIFASYYVGTVPLVRSRSSLVPGCDRLSRGVHGGDRDRVVVRGGLAVVRGRVGCPHGARLGHARAESGAEEAPVSQAHRLHRDGVDLSPIRHAPRPVGRGARGARRRRGSDRCGSGRPLTRARPRGMGAR